jgi:ribonuclease P protein component
MPTKSPHGRCALVLSGKHARGSVNRNFFRRRFYDLSLRTLEKLNLDIVLVPKKGIILDHKNQNQIAEFEKNITFLYNTIEKNTPPITKISHG